MGIFKNITKTLKKAAPLIGSTIGFAIGGPAGAAIGSGIGSLAAGRSAEEALLNAGMAYGVGSFAKGAGFGKGTGEGIERFLPSKDGVSAFGFGTPSNAMFANDAAASVTPTAIKTVDSSGIGNFFKDNAGKIALGGAALGALSGEEEKVDPIQQSPFPEGESRLGVVPYKGVVYNLDNKAERDAYNQKRQSGLGTMFAAVGGEVEGPGTGTSDSVPARLSDGEFVVTAKAVRGAGGGDRNVGAARMYDMMSNLERVA
tara:strand:- start:86 stop:859 length:774 start_codon:yes stop_codon:yes gene_type:complete